MKYYILLLLFIVLTSCHSNKLHYEVVKNAYNIYISEDSTVVVLKIYDKYGESNHLFLVKNKKVFKTTFDIEPIPVIDSIIDKRIYLKYYSFKGYYKEDTTFQGRSFLDERQSISNYKIEYLCNNILYSSGLGKSFNFDSLFFNKSFLTVSFYLKGTFLHTHNLNDLRYFENRFEVYEIDTIDNRYRQLCTQYTPINQEIVNGFYIEVFNYIKTFSK
jgi:hypothetical protein